MPAIAAPQHTHRPGLARLIASRFGVRNADNAVVVAGSPLAAFAQPFPHLNGVVLGLAFLGPSTGEIQHLGGTIGQRKKCGEFVQRVRGATSVG